MINLKKVISTVEKEIVAIEKQLQTVPNEKTKNRFTNDVEILKQRFAVFSSIDSK